MSLTKFCAQGLKNYYTVLKMNKIQRVHRLEIVFYYSFIFVLFNFVRFNFFQTTSDWKNNFVDNTIFTVPKLQIKSPV